MRRLLCFGTAAALTCLMLMTLPPIVTGAPAAESGVTGGGAGAPAETLTFELPTDGDGLLEPRAATAQPEAEGQWLSTPFGDRLLADSEEWKRRGDRTSEIGFHLDYNRVDQLRAGFDYQAQKPETMHPRLGARLETTTGRHRVLYGVQLEQPLMADGLLAIGVSMVRTTDHHELQQVGDMENSMAFLFGRQDYRDYFEREGFGTYVSSRLWGFSTLSAHLRNHHFRSLQTIEETRSLLHQDRALRANPAITEGEEHAAVLRLERHSRRTSGIRAGLYHWLEVETTGGKLGGDFAYTRALADLRSMVRVSPATTLALRLVCGSGLAGTLPPQRAFVVGGPDGLRAHNFSAFRGDQVLMAQAEYTVGLWRLRTSGFEGGLHAIAFMDLGRAWSNPDHDWDVRDQHLAADGGFGLGTSDDNLRVYFAKNLREPTSEFVISARLQRPF